VPALNNLAVLCSEKMGQLDAGFAFAKRAYNVAPADAIVADTLGWIFFLQGQYDSALPLLLQAASGAGDSDSDVQYHLAMAHYFLAREDPARVAFTKVLNSAAEPKLKEDARRRLAVLAIDVATADASVRAQLEARAREDEHDPLVLGRLAAIERRDGAVAEAARHYEAALKLSPHSAKIMSLLVELYLGPVPQPRRARDLAKAAHELAPTDVQISGYLGHLLYYAGEYAWAAALLEEASGQLPNPEDALYDLAFAYYNLGRARDVGAVMRKFLARSPTPVKVQSIQRLAAMIAAGASPDTATAALPAVQRILEKEPDYLPALFIQALAVEKQGDYERARKNYEAILDRHPAFALATRQLALIYAERLADDQKAEDLALTARKTLADDPQLAYEMGAIQYRRSDYVAAIRFLEQSTQLDDRNGEGHFLLGMCRFHLKKFSESRASLQRALERGIPDQEGDEARRVLGDMNRLRVQ
jgi:tetratricopeptide (TPR) repeat protein